MGQHRSHYRVIFGDTDGMGIVYNANYLRLFEMARTEWFRELFILPLQMIERDLYTIVVKAFVAYHAPARYDDVLAIDAWIPASKVQRASFRFEYRVTNTVDDRLVATGYTVHALTSREGKLKRMPTEFYEDVLRLAVDRPVLDEGHR
ncbi:MAG: acyl-CoA thioesterase [Deltaproteobacteria bacterium]|nr:acyl-CoA thioesterase [Deltaproteobacteria bacterium]